MTLDAYATSGTSPPAACSKCANAPHNYWTHPHCRDCHRSWKGLSECHCVVCHRHFGSIAGADDHVTNGIHHDPVSKRGYHQDVKGTWRGNVQAGGIASGALSVVNDGLGAPQIQNVDQRSARSPQIGIPSTRVVANFVTGNEINFPTVDDLFPLDDIEDDELTYFSEIMVADNPSDLEADQDGRCSQSHGTLGAHSHIVVDNDEGAARISRSCVEGSDS